MLQRDVFGTSAINISLLHDIEFLLTSGVKGLGYHLENHTLRTASSRDSMEMELGHLLVFAQFLLSSFNMKQGHNVSASSSPNLQASTLLVGAGLPPENIQLTHESRSMLALDEDQMSLDDVTCPEMYLAKCSFHCPVGILTLLLNIGAIQQEVKEPALPCFVNQPGINNRNVDRDHVYDDTTLLEKKTGMTLSMAPLKQHGAELPTTCMTSPIVVCFMRFTPLTVMMILLTLLGSFQALTKLGCLPDSLEIQLQGHSQLTVPSHSLLLLRELIPRTCSLKR
jgi:hypothetical protein